MNSRQNIVEIERLMDRGLVTQGSMLERLLLFWRVTERGMITIRDQHANLVPLHLNEVQRRIFLVMLNQALKDKPIRLVVGKARKGGASTLIQCLFVFLCEHYDNQQAVTLAHESDATRAIFDIGRLAALKYQPVHTAEVDLREIKWHDNNCRYHLKTAGGTAVGAGGTPNLLHISELSKWERNKDTTEYNSVNAVPDVPETIIVKESTFMKRELFWKRFNQAHDKDNPYDCIFIAWYVDDRWSAPVVGKFETDETERGLIRQARNEGIEISFEALQWRRNKIKEIGLHVFRQEYPSTPEEAVQATKGLILQGLRSNIIHELPFDCLSIPVAQHVGGIDFGFNDATVIWSAYYVDQIVYLYGFYRKTLGLASDHVNGLEYDTTYYCDPVELQERAELRNAAIGCRCRFLKAPRRKNPGEDFSVTEINQLARLCRTGKVQIMSNVAEQLMIEADNFAWNSTTGKPDDTRLESSGHFDSIMSLKYLVMGVVCRGVSVPVKREYGLSRRAQFAGSYEMAGFN